MSVDNLLIERQQLESAHSLASAALKAFPKLANGLVPDEVRAGVDYRTAKATYDAAFQSLRRFNQRYAKTLRKHKQPLHPQLREG